MSTKLNILANIHSYYAKNSIKDLHKVSYLAKIANVSRTLIYFYFENTQQLTEELIQYHNNQIDEALVTVQQRKLNFVEYVHFLIEIKDLYFFTITSNTYKEVESIFESCVEHSLGTLDQYAYKEFIKHFNLEALSESNIEFMYASFRSFCFDNSYPYESFDHDKVNELLEKVNSLLIAIKT